MEVLVRQVSLNPEAKLAKIKAEKLASITMGRIDINYMSGKSTMPKNLKQKRNKLSVCCGCGVHFSPVKVCYGYEYDSPDCPERECGAYEVEY